VGGGVRQLDPQPVVEPEDPDAHEIGQVGGVADLLVELELALHEPLLEAADANREVVGRVVAVGQRPDRVQVATPGKDEAEGEREQDRLAGDEGDDDPVHRPSIAQPGRPRYARVTLGSSPHRSSICAGPGARPAPPPGRSHVRLRLIPREERFFDLFVEDAANVLAGARQLEAMLRTYDEPEARAAEIRATEHRGDEISHDIGHRLEATFVTPFDREDIYALISGLDDVLDFVEETADTFVLYRIDAPTATAVEQAAIIVKQVELIHDALAHLKGFRGLDKYWIEVHRLENEGDRIARDAIAALFHDTPDPVELIKWKDVYGLLEATIDKVEDVANIIERITIKHA
jgi:predicted phosphate transport protein (TIGR00153 family)